MVNKYEEKECPRCGKLFVCTGDMNCWCLSIKIPEEVMDYISARYENCLCEKCIRELIDNTKNISK